MRGSICSIHRVAVPGGIPESLAQVEIRADFGLVGDHRSRVDGKRQLTLIDRDVLVDVGRMVGCSVPAGASRRQIVIAGLDFDSLIDRELRLGAVTVRVTCGCPPCGLMDESIGEGARAALAGRGGFCCRVLSSGIVCVGDYVTVNGTGATDHAF